MEVKIALVSNSRETRIVGVFDNHLSDSKIKEYVKKQQYFIFYDRVEVETWSMKTELN